MTDLRIRRTTAGIPQIVMAVKAGVSLPTLRIYESGGPDALSDPRCIARLEQAYAELPPAPAPKARAVQ